MSPITQTAETRPGTLSSDHALSSLSDADLLDAWSRDQHSASLAALVERYSVMVLSVCRRRCRSDADAEDAFQTTFLYLARNSGKIRQPQRLAGWLHRVAQRAAVATTKSRKRETEPMVEPPANPDDPLDRLTQRHEAIVLDEELADLPDHYRAALVMHIYDGQPLQSLAEHFDTTIGSIRGRLQRGKQMLARRLRHRGVVPVLAFAAANTWTASESLAATASETFINATGEGTLPQPPIETSLLESLLAQGVRLMPSIYTAAGVLSSAALLAIVLTTGETTHGQSGDGPETLTFSSPSVVGQFGGGMGGGMGGMSGGMGGMGGSGNVQTQPSSDPMVWINRPVVPKPTTDVAKLVEGQLDQPTALSIEGKLIDLAEKLTAAAAVPVLFDERGVAFAKVQLNEQEIQFQSAEVPLRTALRMMLRPHGLKAVVEDEGLVITADPAALVHKGIGTARWINIDNDAATEIAEKLQQETQFEFLEAPLTDVLNFVQQDHDLPIVLDERALEDVGIDPQVPRSLTISGVKLENAMKIVLSGLDLVLTIQGESLIVTTPEREESRLLHRIYWLESTGMAAGDYDTIMSLISTTIDPNTWSDMGGPSTMAPLSTSSRPALLISTSYQVHQSIDNLFQTLRESHFGVDPVLETVQIPSDRVIGSGSQFDGSGGGQGGGGFF